MHQGIAKCSEAFPFLTDHCEYLCCESEHIDLQLPIRLQLTRIKKIKNNNYLLRGCGKRKCGWVHGGWGSTIFKMPLTDLWKGKSPEEIVRQNQRALRKTMRFKNFYSSQTIILQIERLTGKELILRSRKERSLLTLRKQQRLDKW